ncbi:MAG: alpha/beta hydrolase [Candidatus Omnitrophica bacterium]|nr:alpha/beta hydrolase [Candidatus Omnitrophota bacterium]MBU0896251.1 alpha/beta hydrolase [Candidatus Omnitrophota bacterium]MBU1134370.1 alpha/beta hydrolase [Candidatus Omnitrophota bacterium]MBU1367165.1 alpha/beta hydrolase [Candidatus Omnitrophota bacterium]MBU1524597.1 alpha/beta hydrolase [Candidatus Omnitrophota bacterium]
MTSAKSSRFKFIDRKKKRALVLIPGWATDYRIFSLLDLNFNYLIPLKFWPFDFGDELLKAIGENNLKFVSLFGFSLGGFLAAEFACKYPSLIDELILVSIRKKYNKKELEKIEGYLKKNKKAYLYKFYNQCFPNEKDAAWFKDKLLREYCRCFSLGYLIETLNYLKNAKMNIPSLVSQNKIKIIHGELDSIAPLREAAAVKHSLPQAKLICVKNKGHIPFLERDFAKYI